jgi:hypothetical protein
MYIFPHPTYRPSAGPSVLRYLTRIILAFKNIFVALEPMIWGILIYSGKLCIAILRTSANFI